MDTSGECRKCQKRFAADRLPPLTRHEATRILQDRQKEKATLMAGNPAAARPRFAWLRYPLKLIGWVLGVLTLFFLLHLLVMDLTKDWRITASLAGLTFFFGTISRAALDKSAVSLPFATGRLAEVEQAIHLLEEEVLRLKAAK